MGCLWPSAVVQGVTLGLLTMAGLDLAQVPRDTGGTPEDDDEVVVAATDDALPSHTHSWIMPVLRADLARDWSPRVPATDASPPFGFGTSV